jgi:GTPase SAR1 family protein
LNENVLHKVRAHFEDLKSGQRHDAEVKVLFLGNGGVGKTQLCRRLRNLLFDPNVRAARSLIAVTMRLLNCAVALAAGIALALLQPRTHLRSARERGPARLAARSNLPNRLAGGASL